MQVGSHSSEKKAKSFSPGAWATPGVWNKARETLNGSPTHCIFGGKMEEYQKTADPLLGSTSMPTPPPSLPGQALGYTRLFPSHRTFSFNLQQFFFCPIGNCWLSWKDKPPSCTVYVNRIVFTFVGLMLVTNIEHQPLQVPLLPCACEFVNRGLCNESMTTEIPMG